MILNLSIMMFMLVTLAVKLLRSDANEDRMLAMKLRQNDAVSLPLNKPHFPNSSSNQIDFEASSKKVPLLYQYDRNHLPPASYLGNRVNLLYPILPGQVEKNKTNAKLNSVSVPYNTAGANLEQPLLKINSGAHLQQGTCNAFTAGSNLDQPLLKINSGNFNSFGAAPFCNGWGGVSTNNLGQNFSQEGVNMSAALNRFMSNVGGCQISSAKNMVDNLSTSVNIGEDGSCCGTSSIVGNVDGATPRNGATSVLAEPDDASGNVIATNSANLGNISAIDGATPINVSTTNPATLMNVPATNPALSMNVSLTNPATLMNVPATNHTNLSTEVDASVATSGNTVEASGITSETSAACCNHSGTSKTNLPGTGFVGPCNISSSLAGNMSQTPRTSTVSPPNSPKCNIFPASSCVGASTSNATLPTVYGPFACVTTSDEHPIFSLQKSSELPICSLNKLPSCDCCSSKCFEKNFSNHGCNLCQGISNERLIASNSSASNNFDIEDGMKTNYKKILMPPFCTN